MGELWGVYFEYLGEIWPVHNGIVLYLYPGGPCNTRHPSKTHLKPKSCEISFAQTSFSVAPLLWNCVQSTADSITVILCAKFQKDSTNEANVVDEQILQDLVLRWVSAGYHMLQSPPEEWFTQDDLAEFSCIIYCHDITRCVRYKNFYCISVFLLYFPLILRFVKVILPIVY